MKRKKRYHEAFLFIARMFAEPLLPFIEKDRTELGFSTHFRKKKVGRKSEKKKKSSIIYGIKGKYEMCLMKRIINGKNVWHTTIEY